MDKNLLSNGDIENSQDPLEESTILALELLLNRAERQGLLIAVSELLMFIQEQDRSFYDLLQALSDYADFKAGGMPEQRKTWRIVGIYLKNAMTELHLSTGNKLRQSGGIPTLNYKPEGDPYLRQRLLAIASQFVLNVLSRGHHFSALLLALADYAETKVLGSEDSSVWLRVRSFLVDASIEASARGRELP